MVGEQCNGLVFLSQAVANRRRRFSYLRSVGFSSLMQLAGQSRRLIANSSIAALRAALKTLLCYYSA